jgi:hypothetical protein
MAKKVRRGEGGCTVRTVVAVLGVFTLAAGASVPAAAGERIASDKATIQRIMALAEADLNLRRAELGLIGAVLPAGSVAKPPTAEPAFDWVNRIDESAAPARPAPVARPAIEVVPVVSSRN